MTLATLRVPKISFMAPASKVAIPAVTIIDHVPAVHVPPDHASSRVVSATQVMDHVP
jgi:hypothetical protein